MVVPTHPLIPALAMAVPALIRELETLSPDEFATQTMAWLGPEAAEIIATNGDDLLFRGKETHTAFLTLARGLAALAFAPGGVTAFELTFTGTAPEGEGEGEP